MRTLHMGLRVSDLERSLAFYVGVGYEVLGTVPETPFGSLTMLALPGDEFVSLELVHDPGRARVEPGGLNHFVIQVEAMRDTVVRLAGAGIEVEEPVAPDPGVADFLIAWVTDPDGYRIELVQWPAGHAAGLTREELAGR